MLSQAIVMNYREKNGHLCVCERVCMDENDPFVRDR